MSVILAAASSGVRKLIHNSLHYRVLESLGVTSIAAVIGGSMGGMTCLEYALNTPPGYVKAVIPLATSARHSAWCISWGEAQRQSIYSDPEYKDGYYYENEDGSIDFTKQPSRGLAAARMAALLTYRSRDSFESRFGRKAGLPKSSKVPKGGVRVMGGPETTDPSSAGEAELAAEPASPREEAWKAHNDGHKGSSSSGLSRRSSETKVSDAGRLAGFNSAVSANGPSNGDQSSLEKPLTNLSLGIPTGNGPKLGTGGEKPTKIFSAQSYLRYQGDKVSASASNPRSRIAGGLNSTEIVYISIRCQLLHSHHSET